ncbi:MAG: hypothetical protein AAGH82_00745 [Pseudomonadota bacterium]
MSDVIEKGKVETVELTKAEEKARSSRSKAIALGLVAWVVILWAATYFKVGANLALVDRAL